MHKKKKSMCWSRQEDKSSFALWTPGSKYRSLKNHLQNLCTRKRSREASKIMQWLPINLRIPFTAHHTTTKNITEYFMFFLFFTRVVTDITSINKNDSPLHFIKLNKNFSLMFSKDYISIVLLIYYLLGSQKE